MKNYPLLVFDWDGTLVNSEGLAIESLQKVADELGYPALSEIVIRQHLGLSLEVLRERLFPEETHATFSATAHKHFSEEKLATYFFAGAIETLTHLKGVGFTLAIATNKPRAKLEMALAMANIEDLFAAIRCPEDGAPKPHPHMLLTILDELGHNPQNALMIGDTIFDMHFASNAKVDALAACYGCHKKEQLAAFNPVGFIEDIQELAEFLIN